MTASKRILVTGGAGFLGSHLCDKLLEAGEEVICLDNYFTGAKRNVNHLLQHPRFELIRHDVIEPILLEVDQIYNLACPASPIHYQYNPVKTIKTSVMGTINILGLAKRVNARILQASTSEVYGDPTQHPQTESYWGNVNPIGSRSCYDEGKRVSETLCFDYKRKENVDIRIMRIFNTYGPRLHPHDGRVVSNFILQALTGKDISIYGDGSQTRSFCYYTDLLEGMVRLMNQDEHSGPMNIGNPHEFTILELAQVILKLTNSSSQLIHHPLPGDDPKQRRPDITLAKKVLKWEPTIELQQGLVETIQYFDTLLKSGDITQKDLPIPA
jgi:UDP-glucuronate decarboxylase